MKKTSLNRTISLLSTWSIILLPALTMWVPVGAEVWLLIVLLFMLLSFLSGWRPVQPIWLHEQKTIVYALLSIVCIKAASLLWSVAPALTWHNTKLHFHLLLYVPLVILFNQVESSHKLFFRNALSVAIVPGSLWAMYSWWQHGFPLNGFDFQGAAKNSLILAILLTYVLSNVVFAYMQSRKPIYLLLALLGLIILLAGGKRSAILVTALIILFGFWIQANQKYHSDHTNNRIFIFKATSVLLGLTLALIYFTRDKWLLVWQQTRQFYSDGYVGGSIDTRWELYGLAWQGFTKNPWFGTGAGTAKVIIADSSHASSLQQYNHFHNLFLQSLSETGILGTSIFIAALFFIQKSINKCASDKGIAIKLSANTAILTAILYGLTNLSFGNILFHLFFIFLIAIYSVKKLLPNTDHCNPSKNWDCSARLGVTPLSLTAKNN